MKVPDAIQDAPAVISSVASSLPPSTLPVVAGCAAFGSTLALSTLVQLKVLGVSTGTPPPVPTLVGIATVALASLASHGASIKTYDLTQKYLPFQRLSWPSGDDLLGFRPPTISFGDHHVGAHTLRICALGLVAFKLLGGRFWSIAPSSYTTLGSFARFSIPATERYATSAQRATIERLGRLVGCHTCGSHMLFRRKAPRFIADHMPPKAVANQMNRRLWRRMLGLKVKFRFYPQCVDCSNAQGGILAAATQALEKKRSSFLPLISKNLNLARAGGGKAAHYHGLRFRPSHLAGGVVAAVTVVDATDEDVANGNRKRYQIIHNQTERWILDAWMFVRNLKI